MPRESTSHSRQCRRCRKDGKVLAEFIVLSEWEVAKTGRIQCHTPSQRTSPCFRILVRRPSSNNDSPGNDGGVSSNDYDILEKYSLVEKRAFV